jgi:cis-3-alkyl-4-acyloxetan-2-one decarboxylase
MIDTVLHKWLKLPHGLHVGIDSGPRRAPVTVVFVHGLADSHIMWQDVIGQLPTSDARIIAVDLLGFGSSPKPEWQTYSAKIHAQSLRITLRALRVHGPLVIVGHSLGSLVAVQYATMYNDSVSSLVLCSPPFYKPVRLKTTRTQIPLADDVYRSIYQYTRKRKELAVKVAEVVKRAKLLKPSFVVNDETLPAIVSSLEMSIENQTTLRDLQDLPIPTHVLYGVLDPFIVKRNIRELEQLSGMISFTAVVAGHEITASKAYAHAVVAAIKSEIAKVL